MQDKEPLTQMEQELEAVLGGLRPATLPSDRDRVMFCAGRASVRRRPSVWPWSTAALAVLLGVSLVTRVAPGPQSSPQMVSALPGGPRSLVSQPIMDPEYLEIRQAVLAKGLDALPRPAFRAASRGPLNLEDPLERAMSHGFGKL